MSGKSATEYERLKKAKTVTATKKSRQRLLWPQNFIAAIFDSDTKIALSNVEAVISQLLASGELCERELFIIHKRYQYLQTFDTIGNVLGLTGQRVRQIEMGIQRKFRRPQTKRLLIYGYQRCKEMDEDELRQKHAQREDILKQIQDAYPLRVGSKNAYACKTYFLEFGSLSIENLGLTSRSKTVLRRNRCGVGAQITVDCLCLLSKNELLDLCGCGNVTVDDITTAMKSHGFAPKM